LKKNRILKLCRRNSCWKSPRLFIPKKFPCDECYWSPYFFYFLYHIFNIWWFLWYTFEVFYCLTYELLERRYVMAEAWLNDWHLRCKNRRREFEVIYMLMQSICWIFIFRCLCLTIRSWFNVIFTRIGECSR